MRDYYTPSMKAEEHSCLHDFMVFIFYFAKIMHPHFSTEKVGNRRGINSVLTYLQSQEFVFFYGGFRRQSFQKNNFFEVFHHQIFFHSLIWT